MKYYPEKDSLGVFVYRDMKYGKKVVAFYLNFLQSTNLEIEKSINLHLTRKNENKNYVT